jgi:Putative DNA-binding domain
MQNLVVHPGTIEEALTTGAAEEDVPAPRVGDVILPSRTLSPAERLSIYQSMYPLRMEEALASDYGALKHFLGDAGFFELVRGYVQAFPSRSYTLNRLGDHLPDYVRTASGLPRRDFCYDLALLERAVAWVFDAEETPCLTEEAVAAVAPEAWEHACLQTVAAFRLMAFRYPVSAYMDTVRDEDHEHHPKVRRKDSWVAIYRRNYGVWRHELSRPAHDLLADLAAGQPLGEAVAAALRRRRAPSQDELFRWFREWVQGGIFRSVVLP